MDIVNNELLRLARARFAKSAAVPPPAPAGDPAAAADPAMAGMPPGGDPMAAVAAGPMDMGMGAGAAPTAPVPLPPQQAPAPAPAAGGTGTGQQKLKPEQMMQMIDYRMYNMQQQLTAIMNAMGVQLPPEAIVLPPGSTSAPPAEAALPGASGAPTASPPQGAPASGAPTAELPADVYAGQDPAQTGGAVQPIPPNKAAWWQQDDKPKAASYIGDPVARTEDQQLNLQVAAEAATALYRSLMRNAR